MTDRTEQVRRLAEGVMGWKHYQHRTMNQACYKRNGVFFIRAEDFDPFTNPAHAEMVLDRMRELGWDFLIESTDIGWFAACFNRVNRVPGIPRPLHGNKRSDNWRTAVCLAALEAINAGK